MTSNKELALRLLHTISVEYKTIGGNCYSVDISVDGSVLFSCPDGIGILELSSWHTKDIVQNQSGMLFLRDLDTEGFPSSESYHWKISFYTKKGLIRTMEGWAGETLERFSDFESFLNQLEKISGKDLGAYPDVKLAHKRAEEKRIADIIDKARSDGEKTCAPENAYFLNLSQKLFKDSVNGIERGENLMISPLSIGIILYLLAYAARGNSRSELLNYLNVDSEEALDEIKGLINTVLSGKSATVANAIYTSKDTQPYLLPDFLNKVSETAATDFLSAESNAARIVNIWVKQKTHGMIPQFFPNGHEVDDLALINAVTFESGWLCEYSGKNISDGIFHRLDGGTENVKFLYRWEDYVISDESVLGFLKYYANTDFMFMGLLPQQTKDPLEFIKALPDNGLLKYIRGAAKLDIKVTLPEFSFNSTANLKEMFISAGVKSIFNPKSADISHMISLPNSFISGFTQKAHIEVDRNGTRAAAVSMIACPAGIPQPPHFEVKFDRPFVFGIVHRETGIPLFLGIVNSINH